jgi:hypothetical protein
MHARGIHAIIAALLTAASAAPLGAQAVSPTNVTVAAGKGTVIVSWTAIRNTEVTYRVLRALKPEARGDDLTRPLGYSVTSFVDATVAEGTTYFYWVVAVYRDGSEGASVAVQYPAAAATVAPTSTTTTTTRQTTTSKTLIVAPTVALQASSMVANGQYNRVELTWKPVSTNPGVVSYEVRRAQVDPATPGAPIGYLSGVPTLGTDGYYVMDPAADLHLPTWYRVTTKSTTLGSVDSPWTRYDPTPHPGVDSITGGYWRVVGTSLPVTRWLGCVRWSVVPGAALHWVRVRTAAGAWVNVPVPFIGSTVTTFDTSFPEYASLFAPLESGGQLEVQVGPMFSTAPKKGTSGPYLTDMNHLQPVYSSVNKVEVPLTRGTCMP